MRRWLVLVALVLPAPAAAQITLVSGQTAQSTSGTMWVTGSLDETLTFPAAVTSGNTVVAWTLWSDDTETMTCTHDGNSMTRVLQKESVSGNLVTVEIFARVATTTGAGVICTLSGDDPNSVQGFQIAEFAGLAATLSTSGGAGVSATTVAATNSTTHDSGADLTPDTAHNLMLGGITCQADGGTWGNDGFSMLMTATDKRAGYLIQGSATAGDWVPTTTNTRQCDVGLVNLDGAAAGGGSGSIRRTLLGVGAARRR